MTVLHGESVQMKTIEGFISQEVCQQAAEQWRQNLQADIKAQVTVGASASCISTRPEIHVPRLSN